MTYLTGIVIGSVAGCITGANTQDNYEETLLLQVGGSATIATATIAFKTLSITFAQLGATKFAIACATISSVGFSVTIVLISATVSMIAYGFFNDKLL